MTFTNFIPIAIQGITVFGSVRYLNTITDILTQIPGLRFHICLNTWYVMAGGWDPLPGWSITESFWRWPSPLLICLYSGPLLMGGLICLQINPAIFPPSRGDWPAGRSPKPTPVTLLMRVHRWFWLPVPWQVLCSLRFERKFGRYLKQSESPTKQPSQFAYGVIAIE